MNDEIKEIYLSNLEWIKTHDNIGGVIGNVIFKDNMSYEEYVKMFKNIYFILCSKDYITNLQQAIKDTKDTADDMLFELKQENERLKFQLENQQIISSKYRMRRNIYKSRCEKASEYINTHDDSVYQEKGLNEDSLNDLLNILQNGSEEK